MSYGTNSPFGIKPVQTLGGKPWTGGDWNTYYVPSGFTIANGATGFFTNDPVIQHTNGGIDSLANSTDGAVILGSFQGCSYVGPDGIPVTSPYLLTGQTTLGAAPIEVYVTTSTDILYEVQVAVSAAGPSNAPALLAANVGNNGLLSQLAGTYNVLSTANVQPANATFPFSLTGTTPAANPGFGSTRTGLSGFYLSYASLGNANATYNVKIVALTDNINNNIYSITQGNVVFNTCLVLINDDPYKGGTGTVGI